MSTTPLTERIELPITGMTCASCAARVERKLNKLDGVTAAVNYATEAADVNFDPARIDMEALIAAVEATGYTAAPPRAALDAEQAGESEARALRLRLVVAGPFLVGPL